MKPLFLSALAALGLSACSGADMSLPFAANPITAADRQCVALNAAVAVKGTDLSVMDTKQKAAFVATAADAISTACAIELTADAQTAITLAVLLADE